ncbi:hypothetical protein BDV12DRAFT_190405 [Aspergillus spectabilis]
MVGVPRSTGCRTCVKRRVKCDETRPDCLRCVKLEVQCLGYVRPLQIRIQQPDQEPPRDRRTHKRRSRNAPAEESTQALSIAPAPTVDEVVAPNLVYEALTLQTKEVFYDWLTHHFPRAHWSSPFRVNIGWMEFIRELPASTCPPALLWAIRTLITFQMGTLQRDEKAINCARHMYGRGIYHLRSLLQSPSALSDEALAACVLLGGYEVLDGIDEKSWISHTRGIRHLMCARGPLAHKNGMGRTLMICFRPFFIAESFVLREPCFLASSEWTSMTDDILDDDTQRDESGLLGLAMDHIFNETAKCPGYYASTQAILSSDADPAPSVLERVLGEIAGTKGHLQALHDMLSVSNADGSGRSPSLGPVPSIHVNSMTQLTLEGVQSAMGLLDQLSGMLESDRRRRFVRRQTGLETNMQGQGPCYTEAGKTAVRIIGSRPPTVNCDPTSMSSTTEPLGDWLDRFSLVMGMANMKLSSSNALEISQQ